MICVKRIIYMTLCAWYYKRGDIMAFADKAKETKYKNNFEKEKYDRVVALVPKGEKDIIKAAAEQAGQSVNAWINDAINDKLGK